MSKIPGLSIASLKKHYDLIPLFVSVGFGCGLCAAYLARLSLKNPDVAWNRRANPEPWNKFQQHHQYKDYSKGFPKKRPDMSNATYQGI